MFMKFYEMIFIFLLMTGTVIAISSSSWFTSWLGLELNLLMMIPLIINKFNNKSTEAVIKYFLVQAMSSILFLLFSLMNFLLIKSNYFFNSESLILLTLIMKTGIPPLHFWFPQIMEIMNWTQCFIMLTWQKIAPFILMSFMFNKMVIYFILLSVIVGSMGGFNQNSLKKIATYSSIIHSGWMLSVIMFNVKIWMNYFFIYTLILISIIWMINMVNMKNIKSLMFYKSNIYWKMLFSVNVFSLAGLPPFLGFVAKLLAILCLLKDNYNLIILTFLIISSLISLFFYTKMIYSMMMFNNKKMNFLKEKKMNSYENKISYLLLMFNLIMPMMVLLT